MINFEAFNAIYTSYAYNVFLLFVCFILYESVARPLLCGTAPPVKDPSATGGRIVARVVAPGPDSQHSSFGINTGDVRDHGIMAAFRRKNKTLVCFYCNKRSGIEYDGLITQWECAKCDAMNFLDENGEITDPPVATEWQAPSNRPYAIPQPDYLPSSSQGSDTTIFCSTCQKNQHLYRASLAQYYVETDPYHPQYRELEKAYFKYKRDLEKRYPQICEDCAPQALQRMKDAKKIAQADWLRRKLEETRARRFKVQVRHISLFGILKLCWFAGVFGQLLWNAMTLIVITLHNSELETDLAIPTSLITLIEPLISLATSHKWAWRTLQISFLAFPWNPKIKEAMAGGARLHTHIKGYRHWYKLQLIMLATRSLTYYIIGKSILTDEFGPVVIGAHLLSLGFNTLIAVQSQRTLKVDHSPLWKTIDDFPLVGPGSGSNSPNSKGGGSMEDILNEISTKPSMASRPTSPSSPSRSHSPPYTSHNDPLLNLQPLGNRNPQPLFNGLGQSATRMTPNESEHYLSTGDLPDRLHDVDEMDWSPIIPQKQHRAFNTPQSLRGNCNSQLFGQTPVSEKSPVFWAKVPPAPITPAQRLRNPPNQPRLRVSSQEVKENFFNNITRRNSDPDETASNTLGKSRREMELQQQRFFAPTAPSEEADSLADTFKGFSLGSSEERPQPKTRRRIPIGPLFSLLFVAGLLYTGLSFGKATFSKGWAL